jgi:hypothetical protein
MTPSDAALATLPVTRFPPNDRLERSASLCLRIKKEKPSNEISN